jgi:uncharacterized repeat protein (TIGR03943 family)
VNPETQGTFVALTGAVCLRLTITGEYLRYVNPWMRWPLLATALVLLAVGFRLLWRTKRVAHHERGPRSAWLMALPILAVFVISPPALGAYAAERSAVGVATDRDYKAITGQTVVPMTLGEFQSRGQWDDTLVGFKLALTGFVTYDKDGNWYVTRLAISCCAADAVAYRARVEGSDLAAPAENSWVRVTGTWRRPSTTQVPRLEPPILDAQETVATPAPANPYE